MPEDHHPRGRIGFSQGPFRPPARGGPVKQLLVQSDMVREPRVRSFLVVPLTSRLHLEGLPGNLRLEARATRLPKASVANVYDLQKVLRSDLVERLAELPGRELAALDDCLRLALDL